MKHLVSLLLVVLCAAVTRAADLKGLWEFDDPEQPGRATVGEDLKIGPAGVNEHSSLPDDHGTELAGAVTVTAGVNSWLKALHRIKKNGGGDEVNQYSFLMDIFTPGESRGKYRAILQTVEKPDENDADYFINPENKLGVADMGYSDKAIDPGKWTRLVVTVDLDQVGGSSPKYVTYIDGEFFYAHPGTNKGELNGRFALFPKGSKKHGVFFFTSDEDDETPPMSVATLAIYDGILSNNEIKQLGKAGDPVNIPLKNMSLIIKTVAVCLMLFLSLFVIPRFLRERMKMA